MHELSIAESLIEQVNANALAHGLAQVDEVHVDVGVLQLVELDALQMAWQEVRRDTPAEAAELIVTEVDARAQCAECGHEFQPQVDNYLCPSCLQANVRILQGRQIVLKSLSGEKG